MGVLKREDILFNALGEDRRANIEIVSSAYASVFRDKAYFSMPVTTGKRYYDVLDRYGVKTVKELEEKRPGALREEIIIPNIEGGRAFAERFAPELDASLIVPGVFEGRKQRWTDDEYMILWLRLITSSIKEICLSEGWEYSNGAAVEFARGIMIRFRFIEERQHRMPIYDHTKQPIGIEEGARKLAAAIKDLERRGHPTNILRKELGRIAGIAAYCYDYMTGREEWEYHYGNEICWRQVEGAAKSVGAMIALTWD